eukprot:gene30032-36270_t
MPIGFKNFLVSNHTQKIEIDGGIKRRNRIIHFDSEPRRLSQAVRRHLRAPRSEATRTKRYDKLPSFDNFVVYNPAIHKILTCESFACPKKVGEFYKNNRHLRSLFARSIVPPTRKALVLNSSSKMSGSTRKTFLPSLLNFYSQDGDETPYRIFGRSIESLRPDQSQRIVESALMHVAPAIHEDKFAV